MNTPTDRNAGFSLLVAVLLVAIVVLAVATVLPLLRKAQEGVAVEKTAIQLKYCNDAVHRILKERSPVTNRADMTYGIITNALASWGKPPFAWPPEVDLATFDATSTNGPSVGVRLKSGVRTVTSQDVTVPQ
ncbi:MAG: hypothetical protein ACOX9C_06845 [Kiritimatiellia bacterium]|jgi:type II secretory pathway pseudopilin PulG